MEELFRFSKALRYSQLVQLKKKILNAGGSCSFIHKYLMEISVGDAFFYLKINEFDNEYYLFSNQNQLLIFHSIEQLNHYIFNYTKK